MVTSKMAKSVLPLHESYLFNVGSLPSLFDELYGFFLHHQKWKLWNVQEYERFREFPDQQTTKIRVIADMNVRSKQLLYLIPCTKVGVESLSSNKSCKFATAAKRFPRKFTLWLPKRR